MVNCVPYCRVVSYRRVVCYCIGAFHDVEYDRGLADHDQSTNHL